MTFETDKNGEIVIEGLRIGEYTVSEVANNASAAYITPADQNVTIKLDETAVVKMHNELRDTPKTGDDTNMKLWYVLAGLSAVGIAVTDVLLPHFSCHSLRHTFTTRMCEAGVNIKVIQDALGHSDISTTLNIYADVTKEMKAAEFKGLDSYFKG